MSCDLGAKSQGIAQAGHLPVFKKLGTLGETKALHRPGSQSLPILPSVPNEGWSRGKVRWGFFCTCFEARVPLGGATSQEHELAQRMAPQRASGK